MINKQAESGEQRETNRFYLTVNKTGVDWRNSTQRRYISFNCLLYQNTTYEKQYYHSSCLYSCLYHDRHHGNRTRDLHLQASKRRHPLDYLLTKNIHIITILSSLYYKGRCIFFCRGFSII